MASQQYSTLLLTLHPYRQSVSTDDIGKSTTLSLIKCEYDYRRLAYQLFGACTCTYTHTLYTNKHDVAHLSRAYLRFHLGAPVYTNRNELLKLANDGRLSLFMAPRMLRPDK